MEERADKSHLGLGVLVAALLIAAAILSTLALGGLPWSNPYEVRAVVPESAPILRDGDEVRVAGRRVGQVREVEVTQTGRVVTMELDEGEVGPDASASVRLRGLAGAVYVELEPGDLADAAPSGTTIPLERTTTGVQLTDVVAAFDDTTRESLASTLRASGQGFAGRGEDLNTTIATAPELLDEGTPLVRALDPAPGVLGSAVRDTGTALRGLGADGDALAGSIDSGATVVDAFGQERESVGGAIEAAPGTLAELAQTTPVASPVLDDVAAAATDLSPAAQQLERALPDVNSLLGRDTELESLARIGRAADPVLAQADPVIQGLEPSAQTIGPLADSGEPLASYAARYPEDIFAGPHGFTTWGSFAYPQGQASGSRAVRFTPVFTCAPGRNPYPEPGEASLDREPCTP